jgi:ubiquinone/menaquinone biosynthesis C-methylase UbiE
LSRLEESVSAGPSSALPVTLAGRTRRMYDRVAAVYPISTALFHSRAHRCALEASGLSDGMRVLEVATGSGEMFRRLVRANRSGSTLGIDLAPKMAAKTQRAARRKFPSSIAHCQAVDARQMPFRSGTFDAVFCCYLLELLSARDIPGTLEEFRRVLREGGSLTLVLIGQNTKIFNAIYSVLGKAAPAFWGRQVGPRFSDLIEAAGFDVFEDRMVRQTFYPSRVLVARKLLAD